MAAPYRNHGHVSIELLRQFGMDWMKPSPLHRFWNRPLGAQSSDRSEDQSRVIQDGIAGAIMLPDLHLNADPPVVGTA
jgi:hypothetical protein